MKKAKGFTLIELIVAVVIVAILSTIAIPSYREYVIRSHRRAAQAAMMEIANQQHQYFVANRAYATNGLLGYVLPPEVAENYTFEEMVLDDGPPPSFTIEFTAIGGQVGDGDLSLTSEGVKTGKW